MPALPRGRLLFVSLGLSMVAVLCYGTLLADEGQIAGPGSIAAWTAISVSKTQIPPFLRKRLEKFDLRKDRERSLIEGHSTPEEFNISDSRLCCRFIPFTRIASLGLALLTCATNGAFAFGSAPYSSDQVDSDGRRILSESVRLLFPAPPGTTDSNVVRTSLTAEESAAAMPISVALKMRDFAGLQARIAAGERISWQEMEARYRPLKSDYEKVAQWLATQGFEMTLEDSTHTNLFARASVARVSQAFSVQMARVAVPQGEFTSAVTEPRLPAAIAQQILSVNGLQPQLRIRHTSVPLRASSIGPDDLAGGFAFVTPKNVASAYNFPGTVDGTGQTIAIVNALAAPASDLTAFWSEEGSAQKASNVTAVSVDGTSDPVGGLQEADLDCEWAGALAPGAKIRQYVSYDVFPGFVAILNDLPAYPSISVVSVSYGGSEAFESSGYILSLSQTFAQLTAAGVSIFAASGDGGSNPDAASNLYSVSAPASPSYPASDPNVTGVGGTNLDFDASWNLVGEISWDELATGRAATGGGISTLFPRPRWQQGGPVLAQQTMRCSPDVAAISKSLAPPGGILQADGTTATGELSSLIVLDGANFKTGGTSLSTPIWAAIAALINQARSTAGQGKIGLLGPAIFPLAGTGAFTDITSGTNGSYNSGPGYDLCTGLGSPNVTNLIAALTSVTPPSTFFSPSTPTVGASVQAPASVVEGGSTVTMSVSGIDSNFGPVTYQWTLNGKDIIGATSATYSIASARGNDRGTYAVQISNDFGSTTASMGTLAVTAPSASIAVGAPSAVVPGSSITMSVSVVSSGGPLSYQWSFDGVEIPGADQPSLTISNIAAANVGDYSVDVTDSNGLTVADLGVLTLNGPNYLTPYSFSSMAEPADVSTRLGSYTGTLAIDSAGNIYLSSGHSTIVKVTPGGIETTLAGIFGVAGNTDGIGTAATFGDIQAGLAVDQDGTVYVSDSSNNTIRSITTSGVVSTLAGKGGADGSADGTGAGAQFAFPEGIAVDRNGTLYVADTDNCAIRVVRPGGIVTTLAGIPGLSFGNADGTGAEAQFALPQAIAVDENGNVFVADTSNQTIRRITPDGHVTTLAGNSMRTGSIGSGVTGSTDGTGSAALFNNPQGIAVDPGDNVYVADTGNNTIRKIAPSGVVTTLAGVPGMTGTSDGTGSAALFNAPSGIAVNANGVLYVQSVSIRIGVLAANAPPAVLVQPVAQTVAIGSTVTFGVSSNGPATYQWYLNGAAVAGAVYSTLVIPGATAADTGNYTCTLTNSQGSVATVPATLNVVSTSNPGHLVNLSTRASVGTGGNILIAGFAVGGSGVVGTEPLLVRASGPALVPFGVPGTLADPSLSLFNSASTVLASNSGWAGDATITSEAAAVGAFPWTTTTSQDSALATSQGVGSYTAQVSGQSNDTGVALAEVYDATPAASFTATSPRLVNLSARVMVGSEGNILIAGFAIGGDTGMTVLIRASGPALVSFGVPGTLPDPSLSLYNSAAVVLASNTAWAGDGTISATASRVGAFNWTSTASNDSALLVTLPPGSYTAQVKGSSGDKGVALVEVYAVP